MAVFKNRGIYSSSQLRQPVPRYQYRGYRIEETPSRLFLHYHEIIPRSLIIRVAVADDHPEIRVALQLLLKITNNMEVVGEASNGEEAVARVKDLQPDVLVMDIHMPVLDGFAATKQIAELAVPTRVILISTDRGSFVARQAATVGAKGFVPKDDVARLLLQAIEMVYQGESFFVEW